MNCKCCVQLFGFTSGPVPCPLPLSLAISVFEGVRLEGREQGLEKGRKDEKIANARKKKTYGLALEMIADITGLTIDEVRDL